MTTKEKEFGLNQQKNMYVIRTDDIYQTESEIDMSIFSDRVLDLVSDKSHAGCIEYANSVSMAGMSKRGQRAIQLFCYINPDNNVFEQVAYRCVGDISIIAYASALSIYMEGKNIETLSKTTIDDLKDLVGPMADGRSTRPYFAICALRAAIADYLINRNTPLQKIDELLDCRDMSTPCIVCEHCSYRDYKNSFIA